MALYCQNAAAKVGRIPIPARMALYLLNAAVKVGGITAIDREITALRNEMELKRELSRNSVLTIIERENGRVNSNPQTQSDDNTDNRMNRLAVPETESK